MPKQGLDIKNLPTLVNPGRKWSLCIGAGTSNPIFPNWKELVKIISEELFGTSEEVSLLQKSFNLDTMIQAIYNQCGLNHNEYCLKLSNALYHNLLTHLTPREKEIVIKHLSSKVICDSPSTWGEYIDILKKHFNTITAMQLAEFVVEAKQHNKSPEWILSFNAEPLLYSLIHAYGYIRLGVRKVFLDLVNSPLVALYRNRIPYIFCHGTLPIPGASNRKQERFTALENLVFLENEYLQLANFSYSWQSSTFINALSTSTVFFVGVSLTDSNMRRWLAWLHESKITELKQKVHKEIGNSSSHYWINKRPTDSKLEKWYEASVSHLGIRIIWIRDWQEVGSVLREAIKL